MSENVEFMFYVKQAPWHDLGTRVLEAPTSGEVLTLARLDWKVERKIIQTEDGITLPSFRANIRNTDN